MFEFFKPAQEEKKPAQEKPVEKRPILNENLQKMDGKFRLLPDEKSEKMANLMEKGRTEESADKLIGKAEDIVNERLKRSREGKSEFGDFVGRG